VIDVSGAGFWSSIGNLSAPALAVVVCALFIWAITTERLVPGRQYRATLARALEAEKARDTAVTALIEKNVADQASTSLLGTIRREIEASRSS
jgi:hypothetical protein